MKEEVNGRSKLKSQISTGIPSEPNHEDLKVKRGISIDLKSYLSNQKNIYAIKRRIQFQLTKGKEFVPSGVTNFV